MDSERHKYTVECSVVKDDANSKHRLQHRPKKSKQLQRVLCVIQRFPHLLKVFSLPLLFVLFGIKVSVSIQIHLKTSEASHNLVVAHFEIDNKSKDSSMKIDYPNS